MANGPPSEKFSPPGSNLWLRHWLGGRDFSTRPRAALPHVGSLAIASNITEIFTIGYPQIFKAG